MRNRYLMKKIVKETNGNECPPPRICSDCRYSNPNLYKNTGKIVGCLSAGLIYISLGMGETKREQAFTRAELKQFLKNLEEGKKIGR